MKAPVGPAIWARVPPQADTSAPATMAVYRPCSGRAPEAMAKAMASGSATTPTITPAITLRSNWLRTNIPARCAATILIMNILTWRGWKRCAARRGGRHAAPDHDLLPSMIRQRRGKWDRRDWPISCPRTVGAHSTAIATHSASMK